MRPTEKKIENLINNLNDQTRPELDQKILDNCFTELNTQKSAPASRNNWSIIMHSKLTKPIAAAIVFIAVILGIFPFGEEGNFPSQAWGQMLETMNQMQWIQVVTKREGHESTLEHWTC
ncbi:MAG: hypothetical protein ACYSOZ_07095, partial [Planctomycetota bacterium]